MLNKQEQRWIDYVKSYNPNSSKRIHLVSAFHVVRDLLQEAKQELWLKIKKRQMRHEDGRTFHDGYLCLSNKQCNDIEIELTIYSRGKGNGFK